MTKQKLRIKHKIIHPKILIAICFMALGSVMLYSGMLFHPEYHSNASALLPDIREEAGSKILGQAENPTEHSSTSDSESLNLGIVAVFVSGIFILLMGSAMIIHHTRLEDAPVQKKTTKRKTPVRRTVAKASR